MVAFEIERGGRVVAIEIVAEEAAARLEKELLAGGKSSQDAARLSGMLRAKILELAQKEGASC